jgi:ribonuclease T2
MSTYWKDYKGDDPNLWEHEWNKHGTCVSTLETHCYSDYYPQQEVVDYFDKTVELFHDLPTFEVSRRCFRPISQPFFLSNYLTEL